MPQQPNPPEPPRSVGRTVYKWVVLALKVVALLTLLGDFVLYIITIKGAVHSDTFNAYEKAFELLSSVGFMMMLIMQGIGEIGPKWFLSRVTFMSVMGVRGLLYIWQGIQAIGNSTSDAAKAVTDISPDTLKVFGDIVGWSMMAAGLLIGALSAFRVKSAIALYEEEAGYNDAASKPGQSDMDKERQKAAQPAQGKQLLSPEARTVISNMAIALDITSSKAWDMFNGPAGAEEARRLRTERAQALALNANEPKNQNSRPAIYEAGPPPPPPGKGQAPSKSQVPSSASFVPPPTASNESGRSARLLADDDAALAAAYYGSTR